MIVVFEGCKLFCLEICNVEMFIECKLEWIKMKVKMGLEYMVLYLFVKSEDLYMVCQEVGCFNIYECWED